MVVELFRAERLEYEVFTAKTAFLSARFLKGSRHCALRRWPPAIEGSWIAVRVILRALSRIYFCSLARTLAPVLESSVHSSII